MSLRPMRLALPLLLALLLLTPLRAWAAPVSWVEVPPTAEGRQWWDEGSLRINRAGNLTVLSRYEAAAQTTDPPGDAAASPGGPATDSGGGSAPALPRSTAISTVEPARPAAPAGALPATTPQPGAGGSARVISRLYVMELDCDQSLYRDISVNGLPRFGASWQPTGSDDLTAEVLRQACAAGAA